MGIMKKEAELGDAKFRHKEGGVMSRDEASSKMDEAGFWAMNEDVGRSKAMMAMWA